MKIRGDLAEYNLVPCSNTYLMLDTSGKEKKLYAKSNIAYLALSSSSLLPVPVATQRQTKQKCAHIIFQINLKSIKFKGMEANRFEHIPVTHTAYKDAIEARIAQIFSRITELVRADDKEYKYLVFGDPKVDENMATAVSSVNSVRFRRPYTLTVDSFTTLFDGTVTLVDEAYGEIPNLTTEWTSVYGSVFDSLAGCSITEAVQAKTGIDRGTIMSVLETVKNIIVETSAQAVQFGAYSMDYLVPPLGTFTVRPDFDPSHYPLQVDFVPDNRVKAELASILGFSEGKKLIKTNATIKAVASKYRSESGHRGKRRS